MGVFSPTHSTLKTRQNMLLIITCTEDVTTEMLVPFLDGIEVFRFNIDKWNEYAWDFSDNGFEVLSPDGKRLTQENLKLVYLRKPIFFNTIDVPKTGCLENWCRKEVERLWQDLYYDMASKGKAVLVKPAKAKWYKHTQMTLAQKYFPVPEWHIIRGHTPDYLKSGNWVIKSLTQEMIGEGKLFTVKSVDTSKLDPYYPWFYQRKLDAQFDITTLYVNGKTFSFQLDRSLLTKEDCRQETPFLKWEKCNLTAQEENAIASFMKDTGFEFGRFDFMRKDGVLYFLELNPNGMWAWLDLEFKNGIFECIAHEIKKAYHK